MNKIKVKYGERTQEEIDGKTITTFSNECFVYQNETTGDLLDDTGTPYTPPRVCEMEFIEENTILPFNT